MSRRELATIGAVAVITHARALAAGFVFDDRGAILENGVVQGALDVGALLGTDFWGKLPGEGPGTWRPLVVFTFWLNQRLMGGWFHETNLLLHAAACVMLSLALLRLTGRRVFSLATALVFAALGVNTEAVVGLVGRADVMAAGLCFAAWYFVGRAEEKTQAKELVYAALSFAGAIACKESVIVFPLFVALADLLLAKKGFSFAQARARYGALVLGGVVTVGIRLISFAGLSVVNRDPQANPLLAEGFFTTLFTSLRLFGMALSRVVLPINLSADYSYAAVLPDQTPFTSGVLLGAASLGAVVFAAVGLRKKAPLISLAATMSLVAWSVLSHLPFVLPTIFAERLLYLPAAGFALAMGAIVERVSAAPPSASKASDKPTKKGGKAGKNKEVKPPAPAMAIDPAGLRKAAMVIGPLLVLNIALAWRRGADWRTDHALFASAVEVVPRSARAHHNLGSALLNEGKSSMAIPELLKASEILPSWSDPHAQLGVAMLDVGRKSEAEEHFREAVELDPGSPKAVFNLAVYLAREGRLAEAKAVLEPFVAKNPGRTREASLLRQLDADLAGGSGK